VGGTDLVTPITTTDRDQGKLGLDESTTNSSGDLTRALDTKTKVTIAITDGNKSLETSALTGIET
jgi:hypothetical protein